MEHLRQYIASIIFASVLFSLLQNMIRNQTHAALLRILCGLCFTILLIRPLSDRDWKMDLDITQYLSEEGERAAQIGADLTQNAVSRLISEKTAAYIMEQAAQRNTELTVSVEVESNYLPVFAELRGEVSEGVREELTNIIAKDLGIARENQLWTG